MKKILFAFLWILIVGTVGFLLVSESEDKPSTKKVDIAYLSDLTDNAKDDPHPFQTNFVYEVEVDSWPK